MHTLVPVALVRYLPLTTRDILPYKLDNTIVVITLSSLDGFFRLPYSDALEKGYVAKIPAQPISYEDAVHFMSELNAVPAPSDWIGGLNISYNILQSSSNSTKYVSNNITTSSEQGS